MPTKTYRTIKRERKKHVCISLEPTLISRLQQLARKKGLRYQVMIREWLWERARAE
ncbi:MAG: CopG antitoxin of type toxin-antitoxin system [Bacillota bacterium]|nr:CopG antitoxin of type toxin-antitoxin system [Bacillota bacterium]